MTNEIPVAVYEQLYKGNRELLNKELDSVDLDFSKIHLRFNRMVSALEEVEQYRMEQARRETKSSKCKECGDVFSLDQLIWADKGNFTWVCERCYKEGEND